MLALLMITPSLAAAQTATTAPASVDRASLHRVRLAPSVSAKSTAEERWYPRPLSTQMGTIVTFDADQLSIQLEGQSVPTRFASQRVLEIELLQVPADQQAAIGSFKQGDYGTALPALVRCISDRDAASRPPVWRQQWLSMLAAQAAMRSGRGDICLELVRQLDARPMPAMMIGLLPIDWTGEIGASDAMIEIATQRAAADSLAVKLIAASWLLRSPKYRSAAEAALQRLAAQNDRDWIARLAAQLIWRTKAPPQIVAQHRQWEQQIDQLPMALQTGPMTSMLHLIGQAGLQDEAKIWRMKLELAAPAWHPDLQ